MSGRHVLSAAAVIAWLMPAVHAQTPQPPVERQPLGNSFAIDPLADLPSGATIFSLLDSAIPEVISDRVDAGSLTPGQPPRLGAHGSSWTQTMFRIGEVDVSDPDASGTPLILPGVLRLAAACMWPPERCRSASMRQVLPLHSSRAGRRRHGPDRLSS